MALAAKSDFELLDAWGSGDLTAGEALFERYFERLLRFFSHRVSEDCGDLVQQTLLACVQGRDRFRREASFRTYVYQTARYQLYAHRQRLAKQPASEPDAAYFRDTATSPSQLVLRRQDGRVLLEALRRLPIGYQLVLELSYWEELSSSQIAAVLDIPDAAVRGRLARATARLRRELRILRGKRLQDTADALPDWATRVRRGASESQRD